MIADLHCHYPIHLLPETENNIGKLVLTQQGRWRLLDRVRAILVHTASRLANYRSFDSGPRATVPLMRAGNVGIALSALYSPFDEMDISMPYPSLPRDHYMDGLRRQIEIVEADVARQHKARVVHGRDELESALEAGDVAVIHCVEGGFHLGATAERVDAAVTELAETGIAYLTPAHLFWRGIATNNNAIPFLPDWLYHFLWPQPDVGLGRLGRCAVEAMIREGVITDISHMSDRAVEDTFALHDQLDPERRLPVIASHVGYRFGDQAYNLDEDTVRRIGERNGVIGLIVAEHQAADGLDYRRRGKFGSSMRLLARHIDRIAEITGSHNHVAIGSDFDGYIKPTLAGLEDSSRLGTVEPALVGHYGPEVAKAICSGNVLRLLRSRWPVE